MRTEIKIYCVFVWKLAAFYLCVHFMEEKTVKIFRFHTLQTISDHYSLAH